MVQFAALVAMLCATFCGLAAASAANAPDNDAPHDATTTHIILEQMGRKIDLLTAQIDALGTDNRVLRGRVDQLERRASAPGGSAVRPPHLLENDTKTRSRKQTIDQSSDATCQDDVTAQFRANYVRQICCTQSTIEQCDSDGMPTTCASVDCSNAVAKLAVCTAYLTSGKSRLSYGGLALAASQCAKTKATAAHTFSAAPTVIRSCGGLLVAGAGGQVPGVRTVQLIMPAGRRPVVTFDSFHLKPGEALHMYRSGLRGYKGGEHPTTFSGTATPHPLTSDTNELFLALVTDGKQQGAFSMRLSCECLAAAKWCQADSCLGIRRKPVRTHKSACTQIAAGLKLFVVAGQGMK